MRARTRGTRGGESTARLAPSRQLEHSRPLRVLRVRPSVRSLPPRYHLLFFSSSPRALLATACLRPFFHLALLLLETLASRARERKREVRFLPAVFLLFSASSFDAQRDRDILIVGKYYENRIKIEFEKEDGPRKILYVREIVKLLRQPFPRYKMQRSEDQRGHFVIGTSYPGCCISIRKKSLEKRDQMF